MKVIKSILIVMLFLGVGVLVGSGVNRIYDGKEPTKLYILQIDNNISNLTELEKELVYYESKDFEEDHVLYEIYNSKGEILARG